MNSNLRLFISFSLPFVVVSFELFCELGSLLLVFILLVEVVVVGVGEVVKLSTEKGIALVPNAV
jgi:hypothetical protein